MEQTSLQYVYLTGAVLVLAMLYAYRKYRDPLHPLMFMGPLCFYVYVYQPIMLNRADVLSYYFPEADLLYFAQKVNLFFMVAFCLGALKVKIPGEVVGFMAKRVFHPGPLLKKRFRLAALLMGGIGLLGFAYMSVTGVGLLKAYSRYKGALSASSGYIGESTLLTIPACILYIFSRQGEKWKLKNYTLLFLFALPHLIHAFLGARRGPAFSIMIALLVPWFMTMSRRPSLRTVMTSIFLVGMIVLLLFSQRKQIYIGSGFEFDSKEFVGKLLPSDDKVDTGHDYIYGTGLLLASHYHDYHFWGKRYAVVMLVRPIPRQIWPTKYDDTGMTFIMKEGSSAGMSDAQWLDSVGWTPLRGAAPGMISDLFLELSWMGLLGIYLLGYGFSWLWKNAVIRKGLWGVLYSLAALLSIYLPAQSVTAFLYRFIFMSIPCVLMWRVLVIEGEKKNMGLPFSDQLPPMDEAVNMDYDEKDC